MMERGRDRGREGWREEELKNTNLSSLFLVRSNRCVTHSSGRSLGGWKVAVPPAFQVRGRSSGAQPH
jgi:hypothetical protein